LLVNTPLTVALLNTLVTYGHCVALRWQTIDGSQYQWTYQQLYQHIAQQAQLWQSQTEQLPVGSSVGLLRYNDVEWVVSYITLLLLGMVVVPLNVRLTAAEVSWILTHASAKGIIYNAPLCMTEGCMVKSLPLLPITPTPISHLVSTQKLVIHGDTLTNPLGVLVYTSGTTGQPKGVMLSHSNLWADAMANNQILALQSNDCLLTVSPLYHVFGQVNILLSALLTGASVALLPQFTPTGVWQALATYPVSILTAVPTMYQQLLSTVPTIPPVCKALRVCHSGAAPMPVAVLKAVETMFNVPVQEGYGLSEATSIVCSNPLQGLKKLGTVGPALPGLRVRVVDPDTRDCLVTPNTTGELEVAGPTLMQGYYQQPDLTKTVLSPPDADGVVWLKTNDWASIDADGYVSILGRRDDLINVAGVKVYPREVEDVLIQHPAIQAVAVVGEATQVYHQQIKAYAVLKLGHKKPTLRALRAFAKAYLASYKLPRALTWVSSLPQTPSGKIIRRLLATIDV
jgi:long-chain acyl-CoA synthetase